jgi:hypothetical protein
MAEEEVGIGLMNTTLQRAMTHRWKDLFNERRFTHFVGSATHLILVSLFGVDRTDPPDIPVTRRSNEDVWV